MGDAGPGPSFIDAGGDKHPYTLKTAGWMAHNVVHVARILKEHPIPPEGNTVPIAMMADMMEDMAPGQEKRMIPVVMEDGVSGPRRWWRSLRRG